ncbi:hypothetical protein [Amphiplicatus metriothermophilus]|uniref:Uncharacterized protein n=1 Tax=Amphiplicatus metriothermophilus TaxID=1519374 RepID=A0A239PTD8_9PROT|nr:hypothetical protein [Amphiplicatus metriothermophilus]MBB5519407.1 hypothetical protein [Amphiplicatus metriothermophilus]SNT73559.1 hypothetical protein SAMN06297382_1876 [Amphiplicatus metriothermophilus]
MRTRRSLRAVMLAATALAAVGGASAHAAVAAPAPTEAVAPNAPAVHDERETASPVSATDVGLAAGLTAALAAIVRFLGARRLAQALRRAGAATARTAAAAAKAPVRLAKGAARAIGAPVRYALIVIGLGVFALAGIAALDIEWAAGLALGLAIGLAVWLAAVRTRKAFAPRRMKVNENQ